MTIQILGEIAAERVKQNKKWGEQNHRNGTGKDLDKNWKWFPAHDAWRTGSSGLVRWAKWRTEDATLNDELTWEHILTEEVFEACDESDPVKLRAELIQVDAVAVAWIEAIDRKQAGQ